MVGAHMPLRVAMWSGPRNISTAMLRAWENRPDTVVVDEPFYASYLARTGLDHPGREQVLESQPQDWHEVARNLTSSMPGTAEIFYQKHMAHHVADEMYGDWLDALTHVFLIRDPASMLISLDRVTPNPRLEDTGLPQQVAIFERARECEARTPPVLCARSVLRNPEQLLRALCIRLGIGFDRRMLRWPAGPRASDGVWAPHWYDRVLSSTGFEAPGAEPNAVPGRLAPLLEACLPLYESLYACRLEPEA